jgi:hypothetical protein
MAKGSKVPPQFVKNIKKAGGGKDMKPTGPMPMKGKMPPTKGSKKAC